MFELGHMGVILHGRAEGQFPHRSTNPEAPSRYAERQQCDSKGAPVEAD